MSVRPHPQQHTARHAGKWIIDFKGADGARKQIVFYGSESDARECEQGFRIKQRGIAVNRFPYLFEVVPAFVDHYKLDHQPAGTERLMWSLKKILPFFGRYQFQSITNQLVEQYKRQRLGEGVKPTTINKELSALSSLCRWGNDEGYCDRIRIRKFPNKLTRAPMMDVPSRKEIIKILRAIKRDKRPVFCVMYYLGLRSAEAKGLQPVAVRWAQGVVVIVGKGNKQRIVPINKKSACYLRNAPFYSPKDMREILEWACKRSKVGRSITPHLFRHAFGAHMVASGVPIRVLQQIMGHSTVQVTEIYSQVAAETLIKEMGKF